MTRKVLGGIRKKTGSIEIKYWTSTENYQETGRKCLAQYQESTERIEKVPRKYQDIIAKINEVPGIIK